LSAVVGFKTSFNIEQFRINGILRTRLLGSQEHKPPLPLDLNTTLQLPTLIKRELANF